jgi:anti-sigma factor RsiW
MNHLTETQINEYLDNALSTSEQRFIDRHLSGCTDCRSRMEALQSLFQTLDALPDGSLNRDLTPLVLNSLPEQKNRLGWKLVLAAQTGIALGLAILVITNLLPLVTLPGSFTALTMNLSQIELPTFHLHVPTLNFQISTANLIFLAASALILWGVGNAALLHRRPEVRK